MLRDVKSVIGSVQELSSAAASLKSARAKSSVPALPACTSPNVHDAVWAKYYDRLRAEDVDGMAYLLRAVAPVSHINELMKTAYRALFEANGQTRLVFDAVNNGLDVFRARLPAAMDAFGKRTRPELLSLFQRNGAVQNLIELMLCPVPDIRSNAEFVVGQAYDVDERIERFRALIEHFPEPAVNGILAFTHAFVEYVPGATEACMLSSALVQCLADIFNVLAEQPDGLLYDEKFLNGQDGFKPATRMPELWNLMNQALSIIFRFTPQWSIYVDSNQWMVDWMRDAVILGEAMIKGWRQFEEAIVRSTSVETTSRGLSRVGRHMLRDLEIMLPDLARWLRLTDTTLLNKSFELILKMLGVFEVAGTSPKPDALDRLKRDVKRWMEKQTSSRLNKAQLRALLQAVDAFAEDESETIDLTGDDVVVSQPSKQRKLELGGKVAQGGESQSKGLRPTGRTQTSMKDFSSSSARTSESRGLKPATKLPASTLR